MINMSKDNFVFFLKVLAAVIAAILSVLTVTSCNVSHRIDATGHTIITTCDTTIVNHSGYINFPKR